MMAPPSQVQGRLSSSMNKSLALLTVTLLPRRLPVTYPQDSRWHPAGGRHRGRDQGQAGKVRLLQRGQPVFAAGGRTGRAAQPLRHRPEQLCGAGAENPRPRGFRARLPHRRIPRRRPGSPRHLPALGAQRAGQPRCPTRRRDPVGPRRALRGVHGVHGEGPQRPGRHALRLPRPVCRGDRPGYPRRPAAELRPPVEEIPEQRPVAVRQGPAAATGRPPGRSPDPARGQLRKPPRSGPCCSARACCRA